MSEYREVSMGAVVAFRACGLRSHEGRSFQLHKGSLPSTGYIHPKWAPPPTGLSLSRTIDNRPVLASGVRALKHPRMRTRGNPRKFIVPSNCWSHSGVRALDGTAKWPKVSRNLTNSSDFPSPTMPEKGIVIPLARRWGSTKQGFGPLK